MGGFLVKRVAFDKNGTLNTVLVKYSQTVTGSITLDL